MEQPIDNVNTHSDTEIQAFASPDMTDQTSPVGSAQKRNNKGLVCLSNGVVAMWIWHCVCQVRPETMILLNCSTPALRDSSC